ncbi:MAG TPA: hypothetical protein VJV78_01540, partial [Polyangiales bacterium]|nr:hypothetical protein [Polyangiales bacterium]
EASPAGRATLHNLQIRGKLSDRVTLGYVAEAPLWRTTYRLVLGESGVWLQAWALLHNDSDENWNDVRVELVNGQPDSFLFPFAAPRYARRRLVTPTNELPSVPQLLSGSADELWDQDGEGSIGLGGVGTVGYGSGAGGFSSVSGDRLGGDRESSLLAIGDLAASEAAGGEETGALFRYTLPAPIALAAHDSLLVPLLHEQVSVERISFFAAGETSAQSALVLGNTTRQTLPEGTIAIFEAGGFGGESALERLKPGERRRLTFGLDLDIELVDKGKDEREQVRMVALRNERLVVHFERVQQRRYSLRNRAASERTVQLALDVVNNARVEHADALLVLDDDVPCAVFKVAPGTTRSVTLDVSEGLERQQSIAELGSKGLLGLAGANELPEPQRQALNTAARELAERERRDRRKRQLTAEIELLQRAASRTQQSLPIVAKADPERGRAVAEELVRTQAKLNACDRERAALDLQAPWRNALAALETLHASR